MNYFIRLSKCFNRLTESLSDDEEPKKVQEDEQQPADKLPKDTQEVHRRHLIVCGLVVSI